MPGWAGDTGTARCFAWAVNQHPINIFIFVGAPRHGMIRIFIMSAGCARGSFLFTGLPRSLYSLVMTRVGYKSRTSIGKNIRTSILSLRAKRSNPVAINLFAAANTHYGLPRHLRWLAMTIYLFDFCVPSLSSRGSITTVAIQLL